MADKIQQPSAAQHAKILRFIMTLAGFGELRIKRHEDSISVKVIDPDSSHGAAVCDIHGNPLTIDLWIQGAYVSEPCFAASGAPMIAAAKKVWPGLMFRNPDPNGKPDLI
jgi:hypothetical protein